MWIRLEVVVIIFNRNYNFNCARYADGTAQLLKYTRAHVNNNATRTATAYVIFVLSSLHIGRTADEYIVDSDLGSAKLVFTSDVAKYAVLRCIENPRNVDESEMIDLFGTKSALERPGMVFTK